MFKLTNSQENAINSRQGTILVSAAAGSGKTAVLVRRVIERLIDEKNPTPAENLLVVTFTKAAAGEMRERINSALSEIIKENPTNLFYKRQKMFLPNASICTMDSFCNKLCKENYQVLGISPDFSNLDNNGYELVKNETALKVLNELYEENTPEAEQLLALFTNGKNDDNLIKAIKNIFEFAVASPYPEEWVEKHFSCYFNKTNAENSVWGKYTLDLLSRHYYYLIDKIDNIKKDASKNYTETDSKIYDAVCKDLDGIRTELLKAAEKTNQSDCWDELYGFNNALSLPRFTIFKPEEKDSLYFEIKERRDGIKDDFKHIKKLMCCTSDEFSEDLAYLSQVMTAFKECVLKFMRYLEEYQKENNTYLFSSILHMSITLLIEKNDDGTFKKTKLAEEISTSYDEILIDEFQDTNEAQNALFNAVSRNSSNMFMVGDVKQSIYRFRQAVPQIFIDLSDSFQEYSKEKNEYPAKISLDKNFRSRKGVIDSINFIFNELMTRDMGEIDYKGNDELSFGADYYDERDDEKTEVHIVETTESEKSKFAQESHYIGELIKKYIDSGMTVGSGDSIHKLSYSDICILLRAPKDKAKILAGELTAQNIPVNYEKKGGFFDGAEVVSVISFLRVIDNPCQDVPLVSLMLSPMFPFTEGDIAAMRCKNREGSIYTLLKENYDTDEKVKYFMDTVSRLRTLSVTLSVGELIRRIFEITSYDSVVGAMENGEKRVLNLYKLIEYGESYENNGGNGLSSFIRYVDKLRNSKFDLEEASVAAEGNNAVRIMSVHKSKGLEFPVVILADANKEFNFEKTESIMVDKNMGVAVPRFDSDTGNTYNTQPFVTLSSKNTYELLNEEMRVLYVALTRAKEKLVIVGSMANPYKNIYKLYCNRFMGDKNNSLSLYYTDSFLKWILLALMKHGDFGSEFLNGVVSVINKVNTDSKFSITVSAVSDDEDETAEKVSKSEPDERIVQQIAEKISFVYPYSHLKGVRTIYSASGANRELSDKYLTSENPSFLGKESLSPSQRGTLMHKFMESCSFAEAEKSVEKEIDRLLAIGVFNEKESKALSISQLEGFFKSDLYSRIKNSDSYLREKQFMMSVPISFIDESVGDLSEKAVVQGVIDGLIIKNGIGEIVDFKTDRVKDESELIEKYSLQMRVYKKAAEECFNIDISRVSLYSFVLSKEIFINL